MLRGIVEGEVRHKNATPKCECGVNDMHGMTFLHSLGHMHTAALLLPTAPAERSLIRPWL